MNSIRPLFIALLLLVAFVVQSQNQPNSLPSQRLEGLGGGSKLNNQFQGPFQGQDSLFSNRSKERLTEKKPITDYLIISQSRDTSYVDTTLSVEKPVSYTHLTLPTKA